MSYGKSIFFLKVNMFRSRDSWKSERGISDGGSIVKMETSSEDV